MKGQTFPAFAPTLPLLSGWTGRFPFALPVVGPREQVMFSPSLKYSLVIEGAVTEIQVPGHLRTGRQGPSASACRL